MIGISSDGLNYFRSSFLAFIKFSFIFGVIYSSYYSFDYCISKIPAYLFILYLLVSWACTGLARVELLLGERTIFGVDIRLVDALGDLEVN